MTSQTTFKQPRTLDPRLTDLSNHFGDRMIHREDDRFESARSVWNGMVNKCPLAIVRCADHREVSLAMQQAAAAGLPISVKGGGHQIAGGAIVDNGVVLDLGGMRFVDADPRAGTVTVGGGALLGDLDRAAARYGLAVPAGVVSHTGVGGLTLGGGIGWLSRSRGLTCDSLRSARVVDGTGQVRHADRNENSDLFWALRGGGGSFGIVTEFVLEAAPIAPVTFGTRTVSLTDAPEALLEYGRRASNLPRDLQVMVKLQKRQNPEAPNLKLAEPVVTFEWLWSGAPEAGRSAGSLLGIDRFGSASASIRRFVEVQAQQDHRYPHGERYYLKPGHLSVINSDVVGAMMAAAEGMPAEDAQIEILLLGGAIEDVAESDAAYPKRTARFAFNVTAGWADDTSDETHTAWCRSTHAALAQFGTEGAYINFLGVDTPDLTAVFGVEKFARLREIKSSYDPENVLRPLVSIPPASKQAS